MTALFKKNWDFQLNFFDDIKNIVGPHLIRPSPIDLDLAEATDLMVLTARDLRIACRVRRSGYAEKYPWDFTIREVSRGGGKTELAKIEEGFGDWMFYGHQSSSFPDRIGRWFLIDLNAFRCHKMRGTTGSSVPVPNNDGSCGRAFRLPLFGKSPSICVASSHPIPAMEAAA